MNILTAAYSNLMRPTLGCDRTQDSERSATSFAHGELREKYRSWIKRGGMQMENGLGTCRWLTVEQLMGIVPLRKSRVYYLTHTRPIPFVRLGKTPGRNNGGISLT